MMTETHCGGSMSDGEGERKGASAMERGGIKEMSSEAVSV